MHRGPRSDSSKDPADSNEGGGIVDLNAIDEAYLDRSFFKLINNELAMHLVSNGKIVRRNTIQGLKDFNSQSLSTQPKKGEQFISIMPSIEKAFDLMGDDTMELSTENETLKNLIDSYDEKCLEESKAKVLKEINGENKLP